MGKGEPRFNLKPQHINDRQWFYEEPRGVLVVAELRGVTGAHFGTTQTRLPWRKVCAAVDKYRAILAARKKRRRG